MTRESEAAKGAGHRIRGRIGAAGRRMTSPLRVLPDFMIIGAQRAGSTSLYRNICAHPQVLPAKVKEVHYFDVRIGRGPRWYRSNFPTSRHLRRIARDGQPALTGEASPYYLLHPAVPERVAALLPDVKLMAILRDPVGRAISNYYQQVKRGHEARPMADALFTDTGAADDWDERSGAARRTNYLARGHYAEQLERWLRHFPREQLLVLETATLSRSGGAGFDRVLGFLGLAAWRPESFLEANVQSYPDADPDVLARLDEYYEPHNQRLWELLGEAWDWRTR